MLAERVAAGELAPDYGPADIHPSAGATLVTARPPLIAFNVELATDDLELAKAVAAELREKEGGGGGLPGVRAIGMMLDARDCAQVSLNIHDYNAAPLADIVSRISRRAPVAEAELVGLAPAEALEGLPDDLYVRNRRTIEDALGTSQSED